MSSADSKHSAAKDAPKQAIIAALANKTAVNDLLGAVNKLGREPFQELLDTLSAFYHNSNPLISDADYDLIESIFEGKYGKNPKVGAPPSAPATLSAKKKMSFKPARPAAQAADEGVGSRPSGAKPLEVKLPVPMHGLDWKKDDRELDLFKKRYKDCNRFVVTDKLDGNSCNLEYTAAGVKLYKRGNERTGSDISYLLPYIKHPKVDAPFSVRAELVMPLKTFEEKYKEDGAACTRNTVSGLTNSKEFRIAQVRDVRLVAYHIYSGIPLPQSEQLKKLQELGFEVPPYAVSSAEDVNSEALSAEVKLRKRRSLYDIDGIVIAADLPKAMPLDKEPEHLVKFKILGDTAVTTVTKMTWTVGRRGTYDPVAWFNPVRLDGGNLEKASAYNARWVVDNGVAPGAKIVVTRSGGVIPKIIEVLEKAEPQFPEEEYRWLENEDGEKVFIAPPEGVEPEEQTIKKIVAFFKEREVEFLAKTTITKLYEGGLTSLSSLFDASVEDITDIEGFQKKGAERLVKNIQKAIKSAPLHEIMAASSIFPGLGKKILKQITDAIPDLAKVDDEDQIEEIQDQVMAIKGLGAKRAETFASNLIEFNEFLTSHPQITIAEEPAEDESDKEPEESEPQAASKEKTGLNGHTVVFSGCRADAPMQRKIERMGGRVTSAVSGATTMLVVKSRDKVTGKIKEAESRGVAIWVLNEFTEEFGLAEA